jgi:hypothetical protein
MSTTSSDLTVVHPTILDAPSAAADEEKEATSKTQGGSVGIDGEQLTEDEKREREWKTSPRHPRNWRAGQKWTGALIISVTGFLSTVGSSIFVPAASEVRSTYSVSTEVATLTTVGYVLGLGCGPFVFAPISELWGRQRAYSTSMLGFTLMNLGCCFVKRCAARPSQPSKQY